MVTVDLELGGSALHLADFKSLDRLWSASADLGSEPRVWIVAGALALLVIACVIVCSRSSGKMARVSAVVFGAIVGAATTSALFGGAVMGGHSTVHQAFETRARELAARAREPGSALPCLDGLAGETVEAACEKALFASPATVAAAISYVAARFDLLSDMAGDGDADGDGEAAFAPLQRALATDRFGFLAHALAIRDGCTAEKCNALGVLGNPRQVQAHLSSGTFDGYLGRYVAAWAAATTPMADAAQSQTAASETGEHPPRKVVDIDFPSAASIPAVSIMNPEPTGKAAPGTAAGAAAGANPPTGSVAVRRAPKPQPASSAAAAPAVVPDAQADPVWTPAPATPPPPPTAAAASPVQLNPFGAPK